MQTPVKHQIIITYIHLDSIKCALCYAIQRKLKIYVLLLQISRWQCAVFMTVLSENLSLKTNIIFYRNNKKAAHYFLSFIVKCILQQLWTDTCKENSRLNKNKRRTTKKKTLFYSWQHCLLIGNILHFVLQAVLLLRLFY